MPGGRGQGLLLMVTSGKVFTLTTPVRRIWFLVAATIAHNVIEAV